MKKIKSHQTVTESSHNVPRHVVGLRTSLKHSERCSRVSQASPFWQLTPPQYRFPPVLDPCRATSVLSGVVAGGAISD